MHKNFSEAETWIETVEIPSSIEIMIAPSFLYLYSLVRLTRPSNLHIAAQNMHYEDEGAFTGEVSPRMLLDVGCHNVILGHSERRHTFGESDQLINKKICSAAESELFVTLCVGEPELVHNNGKDKAMEYVEKQLRASLQGLTSALRITIAYEPVWAVGSGTTPNIDYIADMHRLIRRVVSSIFNDNSGESISILYGGSVNSVNAQNLFADSEIDGFIVGGASLDAMEFNKILEVMEE